MKYYLGIDIGASSGRGIIGYDENGSLKTVEIFRFINNVKEVNGSLVWDIDSLFNNVKETIKVALKEYKTIESLSIDTWGVDYVLLDKDDKEIYPCYAYRDKRTKDIISEVHKIIPFNELYKITGTQFQEFNTIYQLYKDKIDGRLDNAKDFLQIPCYLMYKLTGIKTHEYTNLSTTGLLDGDTLTYSHEIIERLGFNKELFNRIDKPGFILGGLKEDIQKEVNGNIIVKLSETHDTGSAVRGIPIKGINPYISSGTWSLLGIKTNKTIRTDESLKANYSNEYGKDYIRFQKNIMGLWIAQCLNKELGFSHLDMANLSRESNYDELFDVNDNRFLSPNNMKDEIINYYKELGVKEPTSNNDLFRTVYRSLAYSYKVALDELETITGYKFDKVYIVGGGANNEFLNEQTEIITKRKVIALKIEATSIGNIISQMED